MPVATMENIREIVNGAQLQNHTNNKISITGHVSSVAANSLSFELRAVDNTIVKINLKKPLDRPLDGYVEVHGISQGKSVLAEDFILFDTTEFDAQSHNTLCTLLYSVPNLWKLGD